MTQSQRLKQKYQDIIVPQLMKEHGHKSPMRIPRLVKIALNISLGEAIQNPRALEAAIADLTVISGQKPVSTKAKKSVASFKLREGMTIGVMVTLRGTRMYDFLDRLINATFPRIRDFQGVSRESFDGRGNYTLGIKEQILFPEINYDKIDKVRGLQVSIVTTARTDEEGRQLLEALGMPFARG
ncbi:MAG: 50S ribosomal protein L5 [Chloroflexota bacterium]|nr:50S ribosomal protein L5 [Chloroflexota bacterium]